MTFLPFYNDIPIITATPDCKKTTRLRLRGKKDNRRYYLHQKIKPLVNYNSRNKTIYLPAGTDASKAMLELVSIYNYSLQTFIQ